MHCNRIQSYVVGSALVVLLFAFSFENAAAQPPSTYGIMRRIPLASHDAWDYCSVDEQADRLWVARASGVQILDLRSGRLMATISEAEGAHAIAIVPELHTAFISCGTSNSILVVDAVSFKVVERIALKGQHPDAICYDSETQNLFVCNSRSASITVLNAANHSIVKEIAVEGKPGRIANDGRGQLFVTIEDRSEVSVINTATLSVVKNWSLAPGERPSGITVDPLHQRIFSVCSNKLLIISDARNGKIVSRQAIGDRADAVVFDPVLGQVFCANGDGTVTVIDASDDASYSVVETISTSRGSRTIALHSKTHQLYVPAAEMLPPAPPSAENPRPRAQIKPGSVEVLELGVRR